MGVSVILPRALVPYARGSGTVRIDAPCATVRDALSATAARQDGPA